MAMEIGYEPSLFWELSLWELDDLFESYHRRKTREQEERKAMVKDQTMLLYNLATQIADAMASVLPGSDQHERISLAKFYPDLFAEELKKEAEEKRKSEIALHKARMREYVERHNEALRKRGENNGRNDS